MDLSDTIAATSEQLDAVDLLAGPRTFTIARVEQGSIEQPVNIHLVGFPRPWRPGKSMRRVLVACWGPDASCYPGRRVRLYCDPGVMFGKDRVGGTRIAALSHIDKPTTVPLLVSRGKAAMFTVQPLAAERTSAAEATQRVAGCLDVDLLRAMWKHADVALREQIQARVATLTATPHPVDAGGEPPDDLGEPRTVTDRQEVA